MTDLRHPSPLLTAEEAVRRLRIDTVHEAMLDAKQSLKRLVRAGKLRPVVISKTYFFAIEELDRFIRDETEQFGQTSDDETEGNRDSRHRQVGLRGRWPQ